MRVFDIAEALNSTFEGDGDTEIDSAAPLETAGASHISFAAGRKAAAQALSSRAGCLIVPSGFPNPGGRTLIRAENPRAAFAAVVARLHPRAHPSAGIHASAAIAATAEIDPSCAIGAHVSIGHRTRIGAHSVIHPGCVVGDDVTLGAHSVLNANVTIYQDVEIGDRAVLHSGCVIGADGFGFVLQDGRYEKFPQVGRVVIGNDVEVGANACIDRAALGETFIGDGTKLDNMVHIGHNCRIGKHVVIAAQTGLSGGVVIEDYAVVGGQVGIGDKARIEARAVLGSGSGVLTSKIVRAGQPMWGTPARPLKEYLVTLANLNRLPEFRRELTELKRRLEALEAQE